MARPQRDTDASTGGRSGDTEPGRRPPHGSTVGVVLVATMMLTATLGSLHGFSVLVEPLESALGADRSAVSSVYSVALLALTGLVLVGHRLTAGRSPWLVVAVVGAVGGSGLLVADRSTSITGLWLGYGLLFGGANGLGYGYALQVAGAAVPARRGFAIGSVTAAYALGATASAAILDRWAAGGGALGRLALVVTVVSLTVAAVLASVRFVIDETGGGPAGPGDGADVRVGSRVRLQIRLWSGYGLAAASGLMAIGHAAGIVQSAGGGHGERVLGAVLIGSGNAVGGFMVAGLADRTPIRWLLMMLPLLSTVGLTALLFVEGPTAALVSLVAIGLAYGAVIAAYPFAVTVLFGPERGPAVYGRIFTAWGLAGLVGPWLAGAVFDGYGDYRPMLVGAAAAGLASAVLAISLPTR